MQWLMCLDQEELTTDHCFRPLTIPLLVESLANLWFAAQFHSRSQLGWLKFWRAVSVDHCFFW